jgi:hypothetical protein
MDFLTEDEAIQVDAALLSSKEKFSTRLAIYALRCLKEIAKNEDKFNPGLKMMIVLKKN